MASQLRLLLTAAFCGTLLGISSVSHAYTLEHPEELYGRYEYLEEEPYKEDLEKTNVHMHVNQEHVVQEVRKLVKRGPLIFIYGNASRKVLLGCINCAPTTYVSIWNPHGPFGNKHSPTSIWNSSAEFGSPFSPLSPWGQYGGHPPLAIDTTGQFHGYLTINEHHDKRIVYNLALNMYSYHELIRHDVEGWFYKFFSHYNTFTNPVLPKSVLGQIDRPHNMPHSSTKPYCPSNEPES